MTARIARFGAGCVLVVLAVPGCAREAAPPAPAATTETGPPPVAIVERPAFPLPAHVESKDIASGKYSAGQLIEIGADLFHTPLNGLDGVGSFTRADGSTVARFAPRGPGGPNAQSCGECHAQPFPASAGPASAAVVRATKSVPGGLSPRAVNSLFGNGIIQLLAQEMTEQLQATREEAATAAKAAPGTSVTRELTSKGTHFGTITARATPSGEVVFDTSKVQGIDADLVVRSMGWKGDAPIVRNVTTGAAANAQGLIGDELVWKKAGAGSHPDVDGDGVGRELSVGDITAMTIYTAAQETPIELGRMAALGYAKAPSAEDAARIEAGRKRFGAIGCASCHTPEMVLLNTRFEEPTLRGNGHFYDTALAKLDADYDPKRPAAFDVLKDAQPPLVEARPEGGALVRLYGDLKRHAMGRLLADRHGPEDPVGAGLEPVMYQGKQVFVPEDHFLTAELWGVGNTGPWLHDNSAGTLREAILRHGEDAPPPAGAKGRSEAQESRDAFRALAAADQETLIAFLLSLRTYSPEKR